MAVVLHQGQGVVLFWRRAGEERKRVYFQFLSIKEKEKKKGRGNTVKLNGALPLYPPILLPLSCPEGPDLLTPSLKKEKPKIFLILSIKQAAAGDILQPNIRDFKGASTKLQTHPVREEEFPGNSMRVPSVLMRSGVGEGPISATGEGLLIL